MSENWHLDKYRPIMEKIIVTSLLCGRDIYALLKMG